MSPVVSSKRCEFRGFETRHRSSKRPVRRSLPPIRTTAHARTGGFEGCGLGEEHCNTPDGVSCSAPHLDQGPHDKLLDVSPDGTRPVAMDASLHSNAHAAVQRSSSVNSLVSFEPSSGLEVRETAVGAFGRTDTALVLEKFVIGGIRSWTPASVPERDSAPRRTEKSPYSSVCADGAEGQSSGRAESASSSASTLPSPRFGSEATWRRDTITAKMLKDHFHLPLHTVAKKFGMCTTAFKKM